MENQDFKKICEDSKDFFALVDEMNDLKSKMKLEALKVAEMNNLEADNILNILLGLYKLNKPKEPKPQKELKIKVPKEPKVKEPKIKEPKNFRK